MSEPPFKRYWPLVALALLAITISLWWLTRPAAPQRAPQAPPPTPAPVAKAPPPAPPAPVSPPPAPPPPVDPYPELTAALAQTDPRLRAQQFGMAFQALLNRDLEEALAFVRQMPRGAEFTQCLFMVLDALGRRDVDRSLQVAGELIKSREEGGFYSVLFDRLARENLPKAIERLAAIPAGDARENAVRALTSSWARTDAVAAMAWAQKLPDTSDRNAAVETALSDLATRDPKQAIQIAKSSLTGAAQERTIYNALHQLTTSDPVAASGLVTMLPPGDMQTYAAVNVARAIAMRNVDEALAWIKTLPIELTQWIVLNNVLTTWAQRDPMAAARHVAAMPPGGGLDFAAGHMATLLGSTPREAILWAESLPSLTARDAAYVMIAYTWAQRQPAEAVKWAMSLTDEPVRTNSLGGAYTYWAMIDAPGARAWLDKVDLPADTKAKMQYRDR